MKLFKRTGLDFSEVAHQSFSDEHYESQLEDWIYNNPALTGERLLILGRQVATEEGKRIDLLALDQEGNTVVIELKRGDTPRDLVGQINEYISSVERWDERELEKRTKRPIRTLAREFQEYFKCEQVPEFKRQPRAIIVVEDIDQTTLATFRRQNISVLRFSYLRSSNEEYLLMNVLQGLETREVPVSREIRKNNRHPNLNKDDDGYSPEEADRFFAFYHKLETKLEKDVFKSIEGWRYHKDRKYTYVSFSLWEKTWEGLYIGQYQDEDTEEYKINIGVNSRPKKYGAPLFEMFKKNESQLRDSLGKEFELEDQSWSPIWEVVPDDPDFIVRRMVQYRDVLTPYLHKILPKR